MDSDPACLPFKCRHCGQPSDRDGYCSECERARDALIGNVTVTVAAEGLHSRDAHQSDVNLSPEGIAALEREVDSLASEVAMLELKKRVGERAEASVDLGFLIRALSFVAGAVASFCAVNSLLVGP